MNTKVIKEWLNTEWPRLLLMAHYNRDYTYLPTPNGKNSQYAHSIITIVLNIVSTMPTRKSNIYSFADLSLTWNGVI